MVSARDQVQTKQQISPSKFITSPQEAIAQSTENYAWSETVGSLGPSAEPEFGALLPSLIELMPIAIGVVSLDTCELLARNAQFAAYFAAATQPSETCFFQSPTNAQALSLVFSKLNAQQQLSQYPLQLEKADSTVCDMLVSAHLIRYQNRSAALLTFSDVTELKQLQQMNAALALAVKQDVTAHKQLEDDRQRFVALVENSSDFIAMSGLDGQVLYINQAGRELVGLDSLEAAIARPIADYLPQEELVKFCTLTLPTLQATGRHEGEGQLRHFKTGEMIEVDRSCFMVRHPDTNEILCLATIQRDITIRKQAEMALRESEERFRAIAEAVPVPIVISRASDGTVLYANVQLAAVFGLDDRQLTGYKTPDLYWNPRDRQALLQQLTHQGYLHNQEVCAKRSDGTPFWVAISMRSLTFNGEPAVFSAFHDITIRKQAETALRTRARQQAVVAKLGQQALAGQDLNLLMNKAVALVARTLQTDYAAVWEVLPHQNSCLLKAGQGWQPGVVGSALVGAEPTTLVGYTLSTNQPVIVDHFQRETRFQAAQAFQQHQVVSALSVMIPGPNHAFGVLGVYTTQPQTFTQDDIHFLQAVANVLATVIERQQAETRLHLLERAIASSSNGIVLTDATQKQAPIMYVNPAFEAMTGYSASEVVGHNCRLLQGQDRQQPALRELRAAIQEQRECHVILRNYRKDGTLFWNELFISPVFDTAGQLTNFIGIQTDITERKRMEKQLVRTAFYDTLTGLPNRPWLMERLRHVLRQTRRKPDYQFAVLFIDLDRFKVVNDSLGHMFGDQLLVAIAQRLTTCLRSGDTVSRLGGDEFTVLLSTISGIQDATDMAEKVCQVLQSPFNLNGYEVFTTASIGIALGTHQYQKPEELLRDADTAMYRAKAQGKAGYAVFDRQMYDSAVALLQLETDLRWAIERQELRVYYQPIVSVATGTITGFEALVRWQHPERGVISPSQFIPIAEETGLIIPIGQWVLREACQQLWQWQKEFALHPPLTMSVNLSSRQFSQPDLVKQIQQILQENQLNPQSLKLEITESLVIDNPEVTIAILHQLKQLGIQICLDDFGTGYSSLAYLQRLPIDILKIDRSFINRIDVDGEQLAIVRAIATLASNLGINVVGEGIETTTQLAQLKMLHCEYAQGYYFSKPLNGDAVGLLLSSQGLL